MPFLPPRSAVLPLAALLLLAGCSTWNPDDPDRVPVAESVDLDRFMGTWYVLAHSPTFLDDEAYGALEIYEQREDGRIATTYTFREGGFEGKEKTYTPLGTVRADVPGNAVWSMRFFGFWSQPYLILYVDEAYETTLIGTAGRDMAWIMARSPQIADTRYEALVERLRELGYPVEELRRIPQRPND